MGMIRQLWSIAAIIQSKQQICIANRIKWQPKTSDINITRLTPLIKRLNQHPTFTFLKISFWFPLKLTVGSNNWSRFWIKKAPWPPHLVFMVIMRSLAFGIIYFDSRLILPISYDFGTTSLPWVRWIGTSRPQSNFHVPSPFAWNRIARLPYAVVCNLHRSVR